MQVGYEQVVREDDVVKMLFKHPDSIRAARAFLDWLKNKGGACTHSEMNQFAKMLASGKLGCKLSRTNFYKTLLHRFLDLGLIAEQPQYDYNKKRIIKAYRAIIQPIGKRRPMGPSLPLITYLLCEKWNREFTGKYD